MSGSGAAPRGTGFEVMVVIRVTQSGGDTGGGTGGGGRDGIGGLGGKGEMVETET